MKKFVLILFCFCFIITNKANSNELTGNVLLKYNFNALNGSKYKYKKDDNISNGYFEIYSTQDANLFENLYLRSTMVFRPVGRRNYHGNYGDHSYVDNNSLLNDDFYGKENYLRRKIYFNHYGLLLEEIAFEYREDAFLFGLGKFNPKFGIAYDETKMIGNMSTRLAKDYEMKEKIGGYIGLNSEFFKLIFNTFYDDNTFLSDSLFSNRGRDKREGGVGNTKKLNNFSIYSELIFNEFKINLAFRRLANVTSKESSEKGYVFGIQKYFEETDYSIGANPLFEIAYLDNYNGNKYRDLSTATFRLPIFYKGWQLVASHSYQFDREKEKKNYFGYITEISLGYKFNNGILLNVGKDWGKDINKTVDNTGREKENYKFKSYSVMLSYNYEF